MAEDWLDVFKDPVVITVFCTVFATMLTNYLVRRFFKRLETKVAKTRTIWDDALLAALRRPVALLIWVIGLAWAAEVMSFGTNTELAQLIDPVRYVAIVAIATLCLWQFVREAEAGFIHTGADVTTANAIGRLLRVSIAISGALTIMQTLGLSVSGILAFGGIGGIAVGFAAKDLLANFFGGLMLYLDRPFVVGNWVRSPDREIEGTVESIGWRLTQIRTFDQRPLYVPNSVFATIAVENPSRMRNRRIFETIGLRYDDAAKVQAIVDDVRAMLRAHDDIDLNRTLIVNFDAYGPSSLDFFIYTFTKTTEWVRFHEIKEDVLLKVMDIILGHGAEVAFPTSTVHLAGETAATERVAPEPE
tara:strand:- start:23 stop:1102 length:1080 start_codon:yes stop_codon:yes gene_type:complete